MYCPSCGAELKNGQTFCSSCGARAGSGQNQAPAYTANQVQNQMPQNRVPRNQIPQTPKKKKSKAVIIIPIAAVLILLAVAAVLVITGIFKGVSGSEKSWKIKVPDVVGSEYAEASETLGKEYLHGLIVGREEGGSAENVVLKQNPAAKTEVNKGSIVDLVMCRTENDNVFYSDMLYYSPEYAEEILKNLGLTVQKKTASDDNSGVDIPGAVCGISPAPDTPVHRGDTVTITVNEGPHENSDTFIMTSVTYRDYYEVQKELEESGIYLVINKTVNGSAYDKNMIMEQSVPEGFIINRGSVVYVTVCVGEGTAYMPDVVCCTEEEAYEKIKQAGLIAEFSYEESTEYAEGVVMSQSYEAGEKLEKYTRVSVTVSSGYMTAVPDVIGKKQDDAVKQLCDSLLAVNVVFEEDRTQKKGTVISQSCEPGESVQMGTVVTITVCGKSSTEENITEAEYIEPDITEQENEADDYSIFASNYFFTSGVGAWATELSLNPDGTFSGSFHDSDLGVRELYECEFSGALSNLKKVNDYSYSMRIAKMETEGTEGETYYDSENTKHIVSIPYGLEKADEIIIYLPGTPFSEMPPSVEEWATTTGGMRDATALPYNVYVLYNVNEGYPFFGYTD